MVQSAIEKTKAGILAQKTPNPTSVLDALFSGQDLSSKANKESESKTKKEDVSIPDDRTQTKNESLSESLWKYIDAQGASKANLEEVFCRDIDAFSEVFQVDNHIMVIIVF